MSSIKNFHNLITDHCFLRYDLTFFAWNNLIPYSNGQLVLRKGDRRKKSAKQLVFRKGDRRKKLAKRLVFRKVDCMKKLAIMVGFGSESRWEEKNNCRRKNGRCRIRTQAISHEKSV